MGQSKFCPSCKRADNGNGVWKCSKDWTDDFLTEAAATIIKRGKIVHVHCEPCAKAVRKLGHKVRQGGKR